jgi:hypothetical protein
MRDPVNQIPQRGKALESFERRTAMPSTIPWEKDWKEALAKARAGTKMVLLDFFNPL